MSRRTKVITLALFLVLLGIPAVYLFLSWSPKNPLRFQVVSVTPRTPVPEDSNEYPFQIEFSVTNTAPTGMTLFYVIPTLTDPEATPVWVGVHGAPSKIPAGGTVRFKIPITGHDRADVLAPDPMLVHYGSMSRAQVLAADAQMRFYKYCPEKFWELIPRVETPFWEAPLEPASPPANP